MWVAEQGFDSGWMVGISLPAELEPDGTDGGTDRFPSRKRRNQTKSDDKIVFPMCTGVRMIRTPVYIGKTFFACFFLHFVCLRKGKSIRTPNVLERFCTCQWIL